MTLMLGEWPFEVENLFEVEKVLSCSWAKHERLGNHSSHQAVGKWEESFTLSPVFYGKKREALGYFEKLAKEKTPAWLVFPTGEAMQVVIKEIRTSKSYFDGNGSAFKQQFNFTLEVFYE